MAGHARYTALLDACMLYPMAAAAFKRRRARWKKPEATAASFAQAMERGGLPATAARLRDVAELI